MSTHQQHKPGSSIPQSLKLTDFLRPVFQDSYLIREYCLLAQIQQQNSPVEALTASQDNLNNTGQARILTGIYVIISAQSPCFWFGLICVNNDRGFSPWHGGVFRFFIRFPDNYPSALPAITFLPTTQKQNQSTPVFSTLTTHPDINSSGIFNLRPYITSSTMSSSQSVPRIYKILRLVRKAFYRQFTDVDVTTSINPAAAEMIKTDYQEFLRNCAIEASESLKYLCETDKFCVQKFKSDPNLILLSGGEQQEVTGETRNGALKDPEKRVIGLSFM